MGKPGAHFFEVIRVVFGVVFNRSVHNYIVYKNDEHSRSYEGEATWFKTNRASSMLLLVAPPEASSQTYTKFREFPTKV